MKFKEITDDLVSRLSTHVLAWLGLFFCWVPVAFIQMYTETVTPGLPDALAVFTAIVFFPAYAIFPIFFGIESLFKLKLKFAFLKNKFIKFITLTFAILFLITICISVDSIIYYAIEDFF